MIDFVECLRKWKENSVMLYEEVMTSRGTTANNSNDDKENFENGPMKPKATSPDPLPNIPSPAAAELRSLPQWDWMDGFLKSGGFGSIIGVDMRCSGRNSLQPLHYDTREHIMCQISGRTRLLLIPPEYTFEGLYPYPIHHPYDCYSMVDFDEQDLGKWPKLVRVRGMMCVLEPGDILHIPRCWWRQIHTVSDEAITMTIAVGSGTRIRSNGMIKPMLGRILEERVAEAEGVQNSRHWLEVISRGRDLEAIDLSTVRGLRRLDMSQMVRDEIDYNIGKGEWASFLASLISGRLSQTPWLNQNYREPLYLKDTPVILEDTRTDVERQFPEFFREKLEREGYHVQKTVSTVPIPGVNVPMDYGK